MKRAASQALAALAKMDVPDSVSKAYGGQSFRFGREYLIPKPFDPRVLLWVAPAVAEAAMRSGVARQPITDMGAYLRRLEAMLSRSREVMSVVIEKARQDPKRIVFPEGEHPKILRAAKILAEEGICRPILLAREAEIERLARELQLPMEKIDFINTNRSEKLPGLRAASRGAAAAQRHDPRGRGQAGPGPQRLRSPDARRRRRRRRHLGADAVLLGHDPAGAADLRHGARRQARLGPLHPDAEGPDLLLRRHDRQHRSDGRGARRDRAAHGRRRRGASTSSPASR